MYKRQEEIIKNTKTPLSKDDFIEAFKRLGVKPDMCVEVHTKMSAFGYIINKAYDILDALTEVITKGVIIMPAHTSEQSNPEFWVNPPVPKEWIEIINQKRKPFDKRITVPERVGITPIAFMNYPGVERTNHPVVSLSVLNRTKDPTWINHSLDDRESISPLYKLTENNGKILFVGTDFYTCTSIHLTEQYSPYAKEVRNKYRRVTTNGEIEEIEEITFEFDDDIVDNFKEIAEKYLAKYQGTEYFKQTEIGLGTISMIDSKKLYEIAYDFHKNFRKN